MTTKITVDTIAIGTTVVFLERFVMPITFNCRLCGKETTRPPSQVGGGYCSMKCSRIARLKPDPTGELKRERLRRYAAAYRNKALKAIETDTEHPSTCTITCNTCGKKIRRYKSDIKRTDKHYCSQKCVNADRIGPNNPQWNRKEKLCAVCGKTMLLAPSIWEKTKYCSRECKGLTQRKDKEQIKEKKRKRDKSPNLWVFSNKDN